MLVSVTDGNLVDHDARLGDGAAKHLPDHGDQAQAIATTLLTTKFSQNSISLTT